jgi:hypothetical protein
MATTTDEIRIATEQAEASVQRLKEKILQNEAAIQKMVEASAFATDSTVDFSQGIASAESRIESYKRVIDQTTTSLAAFKAAKLAAVETPEQVDARVRTSAFDEFIQEARATRGQRAPSLIPPGSKAPPSSLDPVRPGATKDVVDLTNAITTFSFSLNDAQQFSFGFRQGIVAISNNVPGLVNATKQVAQAGFGGVITALAGPQGLIFGLTALTSLLPVVINHWGEIEDAFGLGGTETEAEAMERLAKATELTADQQDRLNRYKREQQTRAELVSAQPEAVEKAAKAAKEATKELPGGFAGLVDAFTTPGGLTSRYTAEDRKKIAALEKELASPTTPVSLFGDRTAEQESLRRQLVEARNEANTRARRRAEDEVSESISDPNKLNSLLNELRQRGNEDLAAELEAGVLTRGDEFKATQKRNKEARDQQAKLEEELTKQGIENEQAAVEDRQRERDRKIAESATNLQGSLGLEKLVGLNVGRDRVMDALQRTQGLTGKEADDVADAVLLKFTDSISEAIRKRAGEKGIDEPAARADILKERLDALAKSAKGGDDAALAQLTGLGVSGADVRALQGPLSRAATFSSGVDFSKFAQEAALGGGDAEQKRHTELLARIVDGVTATAENTKGNGGVARNGPVAIDGPG